jgi:hypothetical protein
VNSAEIQEVLHKFGQAYGELPMASTQRQQFSRLFAAYPAALVSLVLDDLIQRGLSRPSPVEMGALLRTKRGVRQQSYGPFVNDSTPPVPKGWANQIKGEK